MKRQLAGIGILVSALLLGGCGDDNDSLGLMPGTGSPSVEGPASLALVTGGRAASGSPEDARMAELVATAVLASFQSGGAGPLVAYTGPGATAGAANKASTPRRVQALGRRLWSARTVKPRPGKSEVTILPYPLPPDADGNTTPGERPVPPKPGPDPLPMPDGREPAEPMPMPWPGDPSGGGTVPPGPPERTVVTTFDGGFWFSDGATRLEVRGATLELSSDGEPLRVAVASPVRVAGVLADGFGPRTPIDITVHGISGSIEAPAREDGDPRLDLTIGESGIGVRGRHGRGEFNVLVRGVSGRFHDAGELTALFRGQTAVISATANDLGDRIDSLSAEVSVRDPQPFFWSGGFGAGAVWGTARIELAAESIESRRDGLRSVAFEVAETSPLVIDGNGQPRAGAVDVELGYADGRKDHLHASAENGQLRIAGIIRTATGGVDRVETGADGVVSVRGEARLGDGSREEHDVRIVNGRTRVSSRIRDASGRDRAEVVLDLDPSRVGNGIWRSHFTQPSRAGQVSVDAASTVHLMDENGQELATAVVPGR